MPSDLEIIQSRILAHRERIQEEIGEFTSRPMTRRERSRRSAAVLLVAGNDHYQVTLPEQEPEFVPGLTIKCLITTTLGGS